MNLFLIPIMFLPVTDNRRLTIDDHRFASMILLNTCKPIWQCFLDSYYLSFTDELFYRYDWNKCFYKYRSLYYFKTCPEAFVCSPAFTNVLLTCAFSCLFCPVLNWSWRNSPRRRPRCSATTLWWVEKISMERNFYLLFMFCNFFSTVYWNFSFFFNFILFDVNIDINIEYEKMSNNDKSYFRNTLNSICTLPSGFYFCCIARQSTKARSFISNTDHFNMSANFSLNRY